MDKSDFLWKMVEENYTQVRQHETMRASISNIIIVLSGALLVFSSKDGVNKSDIPAFLFIAALGLFGALFSLKHYERARHHGKIGSQIRKKLAKEINAEQIIEESAKEAMSMDSPFYMKFIKLVRLHFFWMFLHLFISLLGAGLSVYVIIK
ncbi:MAG: hypothetical protein H7829_01330 [Magnetococcus sp. THC-1_WYH]